MKQEVKFKRRCECCLETTEYTIGPSESYEYSDIIRIIVRDAGIFQACKICEMLTKQTLVAYDPEKREQMS
jgi:hypothetical protein